MKNLCLVVMAVLATLCSLPSSAQKIQAKSVSVNEPDYNKPKLFADLPDRINFNPTTFANLFDKQIGESVTVPVSETFNFSGQVVSKSDDPKSTSIVVRSTNRLGARLIFTKITGDNNSVNYIGRIISLKHGDSFEIVSENNQYYFKKKGIYDLMTE